MDEYDYEDDDDELMMVATDGCEHYEFHMAIERVVVVGASLTTIDDYYYYV